MKHLVALISMPFITEFAVETSLICIHSLSGTEKSFNVENLLFELRSSIRVQMKLKSFILLTVWQIVHLFSV
jgi:hypothetical protein